MYLIYKDVAICSGKIMKKKASRAHKSTFCITFVIYL